MLMECLSGFLSNILRDLVCGAVNQLRYPCCFNNFVEELEKEEANLIATWDSVKDRIANATARITAPIVDKWVKDADNEVDNVKKLLEQARTKRSWCFGHCPNWIWRYNLGRKLANKKKELEKVIKDGGQYIQLERVASLPPSIPDFSSEKYLSFDSRQNAYKELMEAVKDDEAGIIGLYGMGGCGKTTMAMEVLKAAEADRGKVFFVAVSRTVEVGTIQDKIASSLQFTFPENGERERARRLYTRLTQEDKILVILDDVWQRLDFDAIGIPSPKHHKGCKVLITTRSAYVCNSMDCRKTINLKILENDEAWTLFKKNADINEGTSDSVKDLARQISDECKGLPVAIAAVASTLKGKEEVTWKVALSRLRRSRPVDIDRDLTDPYKCLELSYDYLDDEAAKSLFLLCSVFPEDYEIPVELLARSAIGLGLVGEVGSYKEARDEVSAAKLKLMSCCLLLEASDDRYERVKMHDLVRDVAHLIAKNENKGIKCEVENDVTWEQNSVRYLWCKKLPNDLDYSNIEFLYVTTEGEVLDEIFTRTGKLRVLILENEGWEKQPLSTMSFKSLTNLRCLILSRWTLNDISFIGYMKKLESLSLNECPLPSFIDLQKDDAVSHLTKLKLLVLHKCKESNIFEVIERIPHLEELHFFCWGFGFHEPLRFPETLQRYTIIIPIQCGDSYRQHFLAPNERTLMLSGFDISDEAIMGLAKKAKILHMRYVKGGAKNIVPDICKLEGEGISELEDLRIEEFEEIEYLIDSSNHTSEVVGSLFSSLEILHLWDCSKLTSLFFTQAITPNPGRYTIFQNLQQVQVIRCRELKYIFSANTVGGLPQLNKLVIRYCDKVEQIVEDIISSVPNELGIIEENGSTPSAPFVNRNTEPYFPKLKEVKVRQCHKLKRLISASSYLEKLIIDDADELEELIGFEQGAFNNFQFQHLKLLKIIRCTKLEVIFPVSVVRCLPELECLVIRECKELKHIIEEDEGGRIQRELKPCFPKLTVVIVEQCHKLKHLFSMYGASEQRSGEEIGNAKVEFSKLKLLILIHLSNFYQGIELRAPKYCIVNECPKLSLTSTTSLQELVENIDDLDFENLGVTTWKLKNWIEEINESNEVSKSGSISELSSLQSNEELEKEFIEEVHELELHGSEVHSTATSKNSGLNGRPSLSLLDMCQHETHPHNIKIGVEEGTTSENAMMVSSHLESSSSQMTHKSYARLEWVVKPKDTSPLQMNQEDPSTSKSKSPCSQHSQVVDQDDKLNEGQKGIQIQEELSLMDKKKE